MRPSEKQISEYLDRMERHAMVRGWSDEAIWAAIMGGELRAQARVSGLADVILPVIGGGADIKEKLGTEAQAITITLAGLAATSARESAAVDNTTNLYLDALVAMQIKLNGTTASDKANYIYTAGTVDAATPLWPDAVTGGDAAITVDSPTQLKLLGIVYQPTNSATKKGGPWSVAEKFGGVLPEKWSIIVVNSSVSLSVTESDHKKLYQGIYASAA